MELPFEPVTFVRKTVFGTGSGKRKNNGQCHCFTFAMIAHIVGDEKSADYRKKMVSFSFS